MVSLEATKYLTINKFSAQYGQEQKKKLALKVFIYFLFKENYTIKVKT
jgi:hypothetical protein